MQKKKKYPRVPEWARAKPTSTMESDLRETKQRQELKKEDRQMHKITSLKDTQDD